MSRATLERALANRSRHFSPFLVLGDPLPDLCVELAAEAARAGATMLELGLPFNAPSADGPAIQAAAQRAREAGVSTGAALELLARVHAAAPGLPLNLLVYGNLVHARGIERFTIDVAAAGASSLLVPDIPLDESAELRTACDEAGLAHVSLVGPTTAPERMRAIAAETSGFVYVAGLQGTTGAAADAASRRALLERARAHIALPLCLGFGLRAPSELAEAFEAGASIAVVGSQLARLIEVHRHDAGALRAHFYDACAAFAAAAGNDFSTANTTSTREG